MRTAIRWLLPLAAAGIIASTTATAHASSVTWPATCELKHQTASRWTCADRHLNYLYGRVQSQSRYISSLLRRTKTLEQRDASLTACLAEYPTTRLTTYDNWYYPFYNSNLANAGTAPGYFNDLSYGSQAINDLLQQTQSGSGVDYWLIRDTCGSAVYTRPPTP